MVDSNGGGGHRRPIDLVQLNKHCLASRPLSYSIWPRSTSHRVANPLLILKLEKTIYDSVSSGWQDLETKVNAWIDPDKCLQLCIVNPALCAGITTLLKTPNSIIISISISKSISISTSPSALPSNYFWQLRFRFTMFCNGKSNNLFGCDCWRLWLDFFQMEFHWFGHICIYNCVHVQLGW